MQETVQIDVRLSPKDIRYFVFGEYYNRLKVFLISYAVLNLIVLGIVIITSMSILDWLLFALVLLIPFLILFAFSFLRPFVKYVFLAAAYKKQKMYDYTLSYEFSDIAITVTSEAASQTYYWNHLFKIEEYRAGFYIYISPENYMMIPKRCFNNPSQLQRVYALMTTNVNESKLYLKKRPAAKPPSDSAPDTAQPENIPAPESSISDTPPLAEISFKLTDAEVTAFLFKRVYIGPIGIIDILVCLALLTRAFTSEHMINRINLAVTGVFILLVTPVVFYFRTVKPYLNDPNIMKSVTYRFYNEHFVSDGYANAKLQTRWDEISKVRETKTSYILYKNRTAHLIPKRAFIDKEEQHEVFRSLLFKTQREKS